jgi:3',5'-cyclic AMP phosphodiesterase CpdA
MKRLAWLTDLHLNFVKDEYRTALLVQEIEEAGADAVLVGGDIGEADSFAEYLEVLSIGVGLPTYFVLGNHDYYRGSIDGVRQASRLLSQQSDLLDWLPTSGVVPLSEESALVGHGGWGDGRAGGFLKSDVLLNDYLLIDELRDAHDFPNSDRVLTQQLLEKLRALGDEAAAHFRVVLREALQVSRNVVVLTHVPPFHEACWHEGNLSDDNWAPHFVCQAVGEVLKESMLAYPEKHMTVLCGHTHSSGQAQILNNLEVLTGKSSYGEPKMQQIVEVA